MSVYLEKEKKKATFNQPCFHSHAIAYFYAGYPSKTHICFFFFLMYNAIYNAGQIMQRIESLSKSFVFVLAQWLRSDRRGALPLSHHPKANMLVSVPHLKGPVAVFYCLSHRALFLKSTHASLSITFLFLC